MIPRWAAPKIEQALRAHAAAAIIGPRQAGKTTLARTIADSRQGTLTDPVLFLRQFERNLVVLDEIHWAPEIFSAMRGLIDQGRRTGHGKHRFLDLQQLLDQWVQSNAASQYTVMPHLLGASGRRRRLEFNDGKPLSPRALGKTAVGRKETPSRGSMLTPDKGRGQLEAISSPQVMSVQ